MKLKRGKKLLADIYISMVENIVKIWRSFVRVVDQNLCYHDYKEITYSNIYRNEIVVKHCYKCERKIIKDEK